MSHGNPPPAPHSSWPGPLPKPSPQHRPPPPHHADYLLPWQSSDAPDPGLPGTPDASDASGAPASAPGRHSDLRRLRTSYRVLRRTAALTALGYFVVFLLLSGYAKDLLDQPLFGGLNVGLALGLCQLPVALLAIALYERTARRTADPLAARLRRAGAAR
ncbi:DUF485 domain-containing protein [Streptomyces sp. NBC_00378]|uniref:DUF485 domain-containing protein n=1 Tax=unclassified Streptomyces TaxID=2593676 RepID=UPI0022515898|nr:MULTISPECIES: DUF485 domain-containing protein [unclassified Streptomyces]MCX5111487.1 DUF485 domain-containing protein [Streptomyces sp. NBC_00378]